LCGSDEVRLTFVREGEGLVPAGVSFQWASYGASFFVIDGGLSLPGAGRHTGVVRSGTLDAEAASDISRR